MIKFFDKFLEWLCILLFVLIVIVGSYQIITRYVFNSPSTVSEELLTYSFTWLAMLSAAMVFGKRGHMAMTFFVEKLNIKTRKAIEVFNEVMIILFSAFVLIYGGVAITNLTSTQITASLGVPMSYIYFVIPLSGVIVFIYGILNIIRILGGKK